MSLTQDTTMPESSDMQRDSDGRLVGLAIDNERMLPGSTESTWLVAVDGSEHALRAVAEALRLARQISGCTLHLVNVQPWLSHEAAESGLARRGWTASARARAMLDEAGLGWRLHVVMGDSAQGIVDVARRIGCRGIVIGTRGLGAVESLLIGSVASKVIQQSRVSVLVVP